MAAPLMATLSMRPTTKAPRRPNASRMYTYLPPARGWRVVSSAKQSAPRSARPAPSTHATKVSAGRPSRAATRPGVRKMPDPTVIPTTMARPSTSRRDFLSSVIKTRECAEKNEGAQRAAPLRLLRRCRVTAGDALRLHHRCPRDVRHLHRPSARHPHHPNAHRRPRPRPPPHLHSCAFPPPPSLHPPPGLHPVDLPARPDPPHRA